MTQRSCRGRMPRLCASVALLWLLPLWLGWPVRCRADAEDTNAAAQAEGDARTGPVAATNALPRMIDFGCGTKCLPCKIMLPILKDLKQAYAGKADVVSIDVWENPKEKRKHRIGILPTQVFFAADGKELYRHVGFYPREDIVKKWKELGVDLGAAAEGAASQGQ